MKIYLRILQYCRPVGPHLFPYFLFTLCSIVFGILNFTLLIPLLNILFNAVEGADISKNAFPNFSFSLNYFKDLFNYCFYYIIQHYGKLSALHFITGFLILSVFSSNLFKYLSIRVIENLKAQTVKNLRHVIFQKLLKLHIGYFNNRRKGDIMTKLSTDVLEVESSVTSSLSVLFKEPVTLVFYMIALLMMSYKLTLFAVLTIPISGLIISRVVKKLRTESKLKSESAGRLMGIQEETISNMRVIKGFNAEGYVYHKLVEENDHYVNLLRKISLRKELASPFSEFSGVLVVSIILIYGGYLVITNNSELSASEFITYTILFSQIQRPAKALTEAYAGVQRGLASAERIFELLDAHEEITDKPEAKEIGEFSHSIRFNQVVFAYAEKNILQSISFELPRGKMVALVGPSGSGKSTLADLIPRYYDPVSGSVTIDGHDIKDITSSSLRQQIGIVSQESLLFNDTIFNNILFGKPDATQDEVVHAAKIANAHEFITHSEKGYQTLIGDRGVKLSGGQKQRINIARAILKNPPILILDEATSALDNESEKLVQEALNNLMKNRTTLVIAHRLSTIIHADEILVLKEGMIVEQGTHEELAKKEEGVYRMLYHLHVG